MTEVIKEIHHHHYYPIPQPRYYGPWWGIYPPSYELDWVYRPSMTWNNTSNAIDQEPPHDRK